MNIRGASRVPPRSGGYMLLEVLICVGVMMSVLSVVVASIYGLQRTLAQGARREIQAQAWTAVCARLRDDVRRAASICWRHDPVTPDEFTISLQLAGGGRVEYENTPAGLARRVKQGSREADLLARVPARLLSVQRSSQRLRAGRGLWDLDPVPQDETVSDLGSEPVFVMFAFEVETADGMKRREAVGATTRSGE